MNISFSSLIEYLIFPFLKEQTGFVFSLFVLKSLMFWWLNPIREATFNWASDFNMFRHMQQVIDSHLWCNLIQIWEDENNTSTQEAAKVPQWRCKRGRRSPLPLAALLSLSSSTEDAKQNGLQNLSWCRLTQRQHQVNGGRRSFHWAVAPDGWRRWGCKGSWHCTDCLSVLHNTARIKNSTLFNTLCHCTASA